jgi:hypothetical protein
MAKLKLTPEAIKAGLPFVIIALEWVAGRTETKLDDKAVAEIKKGLENPIVLAFLISLIAEDVAPPDVQLNAEEQSAVDTIRVNGDLIKTLFASMA